MMDAKAQRREEAKGSRLRTAVLLAAGRGTRLRPHTDVMPKPLLPIAGRPTLDYVLTAVARAGFDRVVLVTHYLEQQIFDYVGDGSQWGLEAAFAHQAQMAGTGDALHCAIVAQPAWFDAPFLLAATDYILRPDFLSELVGLYAASSAEIVTSLKQLPLDQLVGRSSVRFAEPAKAPDSAITEIVEKPAAGSAPSTFSANLIYLLPPQICPLLDNIAPSPRGEKEVQQAINQLLHAGLPARGLLQGQPPEWAPSP